MWLALRTVSTFCFCAWLFRFPLSLVYQLSRELLCHLWFFGISRLPWPLRHACKENWLPEFFKSYFEGKIIAEAAAVDSVGGDASKVCVVKPTFIYGGDSFGLIPPRVNYEYGAGVEELLFLPPFKLLADVTPGLIKVALRPPVCVDSVAAACAKAATDESGAALSTLDGTEAINAYSGQPKSTGLTDALEFTNEKLTEFYDWAKVELPKALDTVQSKIEEAKK